MREKWVVSLMFTVPLSIFAPDFYGSVQFIHNLKDFEPQVLVQGCLIQEVMDLLLGCCRVLPADECIEPGQHKKYLSLALYLRQCIQRRSQAGKGEVRL